MDFSEFLGSLVLSKVEGLLLCTCAELVSVSRQRSNNTRSRTVITWDCVGDNCCFNAHRQLPE